MTFGNFVKMHGLGNDFVIIDCRDAPLKMTSAKARHISDRHTGIGCDQLILLNPSDIADVSMLIYNSDGGEVESCGNASRCVVALLDVDCSIQTGGGIIYGKIDDNGVTVNMGLARFEWQEIPLAFAMDTDALPLTWEDLSAPMAINVGNPHVVFFVDDCDATDLVRLGPVIEIDAAFPQHINVNVASVHSGELKLRVWERGVGLTRACGTGACASAVAAIKQGLLSTPVTVNLPGGALTIAWQTGAPIIMTGSTSFIYSGHTNWDDFG